MSTHISATTASEQDVDLSSPTATMTLVLKKHGKELSKAETLPEVREVMKKVASFQLPESKLVKKTVEALAKQKAKSAAIDYLNLFKGKVLIERWTALINEVQHEFSEFDDAARPFNLADQMAADEKLAAKKPAAKTDLVHAPGAIVPAEKAGA